VRQLANLDEEVALAALRTFEAAGAAAEWLVSPAFGLGGAVPVAFLQRAGGRNAVIQLLGRIEHNIP
jgi:uncharacterized protein (DUF2384 family)